MQACCDNEDMYSTDDGETIYPELCDCICHHVSEEDL